MPNKYIRHGATYCGDGTTSDLAASNGAPGAWNNISILTGATPASLGGSGSVAAGDTVYIRSKDASGSDITVTISANTTFGSSSGVVTNYVSWVIDDGVIWSGVSGVVTYTTSNTSYNFTFQSYNYIKASTQDAFVIQSTNTGSGGTQLVAFNHSIVENAKFILPTSSNVGYTMTNSGGNVTLISPHIVATKHYGILRSSGGSATLTVVGADIELTGLVTAYAMFFDIANSAGLQIIGGQVRGVGATTGAIILNATTGTTAQIHIVGFKFPNTMTLNLQGPAINHSITAFAADGSSTAYTQAPWGVADSRLDSNYPSLGAVLPDSNATPWAWRIYPQNASNMVPATLLLSRYYSGSDAENYIGVEVIISDVFSGVNANNVWIDVDYVDADTNTKRLVSSRKTSGSLVSSIAAWSSLTWGMISCANGRYYLSTPSPVKIKQNTMVVVRVCCSLRAASANDAVFVDPDIKFS